MPFQLESNYQPRGDQSQAIAKLIKSVEGGNRHQTLLGVTGSGKTFTMANVIARMGRPALVMIDFQRDMYLPGSEGGIPRMGGADVRVPRARGLVDAARKYVASRTLTTAGWSNTTILSGDATEAILAGISARAIRAGEAAVTAHLDRAENQLRRH